jgi:hypothetical protein
MALYSHNAMERVECLEAGLLFQLGIFLVCFQKFLFGRVETAARRRTNLGLLTAEEPDCKQLNNNGTMETPIVRKKRTTYLFRNSWSLRKQTCRVNSCTFSLMDFALTICPSMHFR